MELGNSEIGNLEIGEVQPCWSKTRYDSTLTIPGEYGGKWKGQKGSISINFLYYTMHVILWTWQLDDVNLTTWTSRASQCELNFHQAHKLGK